MDEVAAIQRQFGHLLRCDHLAQRGIRGFDCDGRGGHFHVLLHRCRRKREVQFPLFVCLQNDVSGLFRAESIDFGAHRVRCNAEQRNDVMSGIVRYRVARGSRCGRRDRYLGPGDAPPVASVTVPEIVPVACPKAVETKASRTQQPRAANNKFLRFISLPFSVHDERVELGLLNLTPGDLAPVS